jgi:hypothetical protein
MTSVGGQSARQSVHKRRVNDLIFESLQEHRDAAPIAFFCECPSVRCYDTVWLSVTEYEAGRGSPRWSVRAEGH